MQAQILKILLLLVLLSACSAGPVESGSGGSTSFSDNFQDSDTPFGSGGVPGKGGTGGNAAGGSSSRPSLGGQGGVPLSCALALPSTFTWTPAEHLDCVTSSCTGTGTLTWADPMPLSENESIWEIELLDGETTSTEGLQYQGEMCRDEYSAGADIRQNVFTLTFSGDTTAVFPETTDLWIGIKTDCPVSLSIREGFMDALQQISLHCS